MFSTTIHCSLTVVYCRISSNSSYDPHWWKDREDFEHSNLPPCLPKASGANVKCDSDANCSVDQVGMMTHFTDYSMSSSVIPRSEGTHVHDMHAVT